MRVGRSQGSENVEVVMVQVGVKVERGWKS